jgi:quercetin dioxygenase-like cupin family protein
VEHVGLVLSGQAVAKLDDGTERLMKAGDFFSVSLHILGGEDNAAPPEYPE